MKEPMNGSQNTRRKKSQENSQQVNRSYKSFEFLFTLTLYHFHDSFDLYDFHDPYDSYDFYDPYDLYSFSQKNKYYGKRLERISGQEQGPFS